MQLTGRVQIVHYRQPTPLTTTAVMTALTIESVTGQGRARCVGLAPLLQRGVLVSLTGAWEVHKTYGRQFRFTTGRVLPPRSLAELATQLSSPLFAGLGPGRIQSLLTHVGTGLLGLLADTSMPAGAETARQALARVPGFGPKLIHHLVTTWAATYPIFADPTLVTTSPGTVAVCLTPTETPLACRVTG